MWFAMLVVMLSSGEVQRAPSPTMYASEAECVAATSKIEHVVNADKNVKAYALKCFQFTADDVKPNGEPT